MSIKSNRMRMEMTQAQLAEKAGVSQSMICSIEAGNRSPSLNLALVLSRIFGISVEELLAEVPCDDDGFVPVGRSFMEINYKPETNEECLTMIHEVMWNEFKEWIGGELPTDRKELAEKAKEFAGEVGFTVPE